MDTKSIRLNNLQTLIARHSTQSKFAEAVDTAPAYISQILSNDHPANLGSALARKIEKNLNLEHGWMDREHNTISTLSERINQAMNFSKINNSTLAKATNITRSAITQWRNGTTKNLDAKTCIRAANAMNISASWLADGSGKMTDQATPQPQTLADRTRTARKKAGISQAELAQKIGVKQSSIGNIESGRNLSATFLPQLAAALDVDALWLVNGTSDTTNTLATRIKRARAQAKITQSELANKAGLSQNHISQLENSARKNTTKIMELASALDVNPNWLATGNDTEENTTGNIINQLERLASLLEKGHLTKQEFTKLKEKLIG